MIRLACGIVVAVVTLVGCGATEPDLFAAAETPSTPGGQAGGSVVRQADTSPDRASDSTKNAVATPRFEWDPTWPKELPDNWVLGMIGGVAVDTHDHIWIANRFRTLTSGEKTEACCTAAPPIIEFDQAGNVVQGWGGPGPGYQWPGREHGIAIDHKDSVWIGGNANGAQNDGSPNQRDNMILKFTRAGTFMRQIGREGQSKGSNDVENLGEPAGITVDRTANEVWVADGYKNRRVIVFDADTGAYKRHFGAYGNKPDDTPYKYDRASDATLPQQFNTPVHCVRISNDGFVYVCDRTNDRIQVFRKDGTFVKEKLITPRIRGAVATDLAFSPDPGQRFMYVLDHVAQKVWITRREDMDVVGSFGRAGHFGGQFTVPHAMAVDSKGNIYVGESLEGKRIQRFLYKGVNSPSNSGR